jgi:phage terminase large subunit
VPLVEIDYTPRPLQTVLHAALDRHRFSVAVCHRRFGKTVLAINQLIKSALLCPRERPRFAYLAPTYAQGKSVAFDYIQHFSRAIPGVQFNQSELRADYPNGGQLRIYGADSPDSLRGIYLDGIVLDEYGLMSPKVFSEVIRPALSDRLGWAFFIGTPNGKNQFYDIVQHAKAQPDWYFADYKASQTHILDQAELAAARKDMTADEYAQEYECSFDASIKGAYYAAELDAARTQGRIQRVPYDPILPVDTDWDLGVGDATAIWFTQSVKSGEVRVIDFYESSGEGLPHYAQVLRTKGYTYGQHWAPHDIQVKEFSSGRSRLETAAALGIRFQIAPNVPMDDGIHAVRMLFPRCWFDADKCKAGIEALQHYRRDYNSRLNEFKPVPVHDWASHASDAFRYLAVRQKTPKDKKPVTLYRPSLAGAAGWMGG